MAEMSDDKSFFFLDDIFDDGARAEETKSVKISNLDDGVAYSGAINYEHFSIIAGRRQRLQSPPPQ